MKKACTAKNGHCPVVVLSIHVTPPYNHLRLFFSCYLRHPLLFHFLVLALLTDHRISSLSLLPIITSEEQTLIELILCAISFARSLSLSFTCSKLVFDTQSVSQPVSMCVHLHIGKLVVQLVCSTSLSVSQSACLLITFLVIAKLPTL